MLRILHGPPGTGKTWRAARDAVKLLEPGTADTELEARHQQLVAAGRIVWVTFHPSTTYEDFVEGYRPVVVDGQLVYQVRKGPFRKACDRVQGVRDEPLSAFIQPGDQLKDGAGRLRYTVASVDEGGVVVRSPGHGGAGDQHRFVDFYTLLQVHSAGLDPLALCLQINTAYLPATLGLDPATLPAAIQAEQQALGAAFATGHRRGRELRTAVAQLLQQSPTDINAANHKGAVMRTLLERGAFNGEVEPGPVVLVIDEINRADLSRVFGELITLLEPDKREGAEQARTVVLPASQERFSVPQDLHVVATMNTADRSLTSLDFAMRRRFEFVEVRPDPTLCPDVGGVAVGALLDRLNERIAALRSRDHCLGHAALLPDKLARRAERFGGDEVRAVAHVLRTRIVPLLLEYFHEDWRKVAAVLAPSAEPGWAPTQRLLVPAEPDAGLTRALDDDWGTELVGGFELAGWWDPTSDNFDKVRVVEVLNRIAGDV